MDLSLTEQQKMLQATARELVVRDYNRETLVAIDAGRQSSVPHWAGLVSTGLLGVLVPEEYGGAGGSLTDAGVAYEELGQGPVPGPHFSSGVLAALTVLEGGTDEQRVALLPAIASGERVFAVAVTEPDYGWEPERVQAICRRDDGGLVLDGVKLYVHDAMEATDLIVAARLDDGVVLVLVSADAPGVYRRPLTGFATGLAEARFTGVAVAESDIIGGGASDGWAVLERAFTKALPVLSAYQVGGLTRVFETTLAYSRSRRQFEQPIGRFQRVQDHIIDIVNHLDAARWTTYEALWLVDSGREHAASVHMAAAVASEAYYLGCNSAHDVHAGVGVMREYGLTLHTKMSRTLYHYLGNPRFHRRRIAEALSLAV